MGKLKDEIVIHLDPSIAADEKAQSAYREFLKIIPGRILQCPLDVTRSNKQGITRDDKVYKFGYKQEHELVFVEYFDSRNQTQPTMGLYVDKKGSAMSIRGRKGDKNFFMNFCVINGKVESNSRFE